MALREVGSEGHASSATATYKLFKTSTASPQLYTKAVFPNAVSVFSKVPSELYLKTDLEL